MEFPYGDLPSITPEESIWKDFDAINIDQKGCWKSHFAVENYDWKYEPIGTLQKANICRSFSEGLYP